MSAHLNILVHDMINLLYYEYWTDKQKYLYAVNYFRRKAPSQMFDWILKATLERLHCR